MRFLTMLILALTLAHSAVWACGCGSAKCSKETGPMCACSMPGCAMPSTLNPAAPAPIQAPAH